MDPELLKRKKGDMETRAGRVGSPTPDTRDTELHRAGIKMPNVA